MSARGDDKRLLLRATEISGLPVVSIADGEAVADVKDVVYDPERGGLVGFTMNKRGFLKGPMKAVLPISSVVAIGRDAVMVADTDACEEKGSGPAAEVSAGGVGNVVGNEVLTDAGRRLGKVTDVVVAADSGAVLGYELEGDEDLQGHAGQRLFLPIPDTLAVSGQALMVPATAEPFIRDDLSGFGAAVDEFRAELARGRSNRR
ncbi:MAG TPA: PRC-barrel domain-containing protein [Acidimicrobiales bacterium]|nr:PRC-barrel domain-containing protein [Acidimicrobiales bacterium]